MLINIATVLCNNRWDATVQGDGVKVSGYDKKHQYNLFIFRLAPLRF